MKDEILELIKMGEFETVKSGKASPGFSFEDSMFRLVLFR